MLYEPFARIEFGSHHLKHSNDNCNCELISRFEIVLHFKSMIVLISEFSYKLSMPVHRNINSMGK